MFLTVRHSPATLLGWLVFSFLFLLASPAQARGTYEAPEDFLTRVFAGEVPKPKAFWLTGEHKKVATDILKHKPARLREKYWQGNNKNVWIMEEIGKEQPITTGIVINDGKIEEIKVLVFRESRGWEVRHSFFTDQFIGALLKSNRSLDRDIDGISGATLSVRALKKLGRLALYLDQHITH